MSVFHSEPYSAGAPCAAPLCSDGRSGPRADRPRHCLPPSVLSAARWHAQTVFLPKGMDPWPGLACLRVFAGRFLWDAAPIRSLFRSCRSAAPTALTVFVCLCLACVQEGRLPQVPGRVRHRKRAEGRCRELPAGLQGSHRQRYDGAAAHTPHPVRYCPPHTPSGEILPLTHPIR